MGFYWCQMYVYFTIIQLAAVCTNVSSWKLFHVSYQLKRVLGYVLLMYTTDNNIRINFFQMCQEICIARDNISEKGFYEYFTLISFYVGIEKRWKECNIKISYFTIPMILIFLLFKDTR